MTSNIILECSQKDATNSVSNSNWVSTFQSDQTIETGDTLRMKQCLINTQAINSQNIVLDEDVTVIVKFVVYDNVLPKEAIPFADTIITGGKDSNTNVQDQQTNDNCYRAVIIPTDPTVTNVSFVQKQQMKGYYLLRNVDDDTLVEYTIEIPLQAGSYPPQELAGYITGQLKKYKGDEQLGTAVTPNFSDTIGGALRYNFVAVDTNTTSTLVQKYRMERIMMQSDAGGQKGFVTRMLGSSDSLFEYKDTAFQFSFLHTPIYTEKTTGSNASFTIYKTPGVSVTSGTLATDASNAETTAKFPPFVYDSYGGVLLTDLEPKSFWNNLGFSNTQLTDILFDDTVFSATSTLILKNEYIKSRTTGVNLASAFVRSDLFSSPFNQIIPRTNAGQEFQPDELYPIAVTVATADVRPIIAKLPYVVDNIGFYRIEAITALSNEYNTPNERKSKVTAVVSKNYNTNDFITGYGGDSSLDYEHIGETTVLNNVQIRIVDPLTEKEVENLGPNSTVFMELVKAPPQQKSNVKHK